MDLADLVDWIDLVVKEGVKNLHVGVFDEFLVRY